MGLLRILLIIILVYYAMKFISRLLLPLMAKKVVEKAQKDMNERMRQAYNQQNASGAQQEGDVIIQKGAAKHNKTVSNEEGEYVDFEEIKE